MTLPLHQVKAELFRTLGHPVRIRVLELLLDGPKQVRELLAEIDVEPSNLSQQLAVLRRADLVSSSREGATVLYRLSTPDVAELMAAARRILTSVLTNQETLLADLRAADRP
jgi:ArsR family transcriptional regulator